MAGTPTIEFSVLGFGHHYTASTQSDIIAYLDLLKNNRADAEKVTIANCYFSRYANSWHKAVEIPNFIIMPKYDRAIKNIEIATRHIAADRATVLYDIPLAHLKVRSAILKSG